MYDLDLKKLNGSLVKSVKLLAAVRRSFGLAWKQYPELQDLNREIREAAGECQRVLELVEADADRPLING